MKYNFYFEAMTVLLTQKFYLHQVGTVEVFY